MLGWVQKGSLSAARWFGYHPEKISKNVLYEISWIFEPLDCKKRFYTYPTLLLMLCFVT